MKEDKEKVPPIGKTSILYCNVLYCTVLYCTVFYADLCSVRDTVVPLMDLVDDNSECWLWGNTPPGTAERTER